MFGFWFDLPPLLRACFALLLIGIAVLIYFISDGTRIAYGAGIVGIILLLSSTAGSNKGGYNF
jgi:hypothetical protein